MNKKILIASIFATLMLLVGTVLPASGTLIIDTTASSNMSGNTLYVGGSGEGNHEYDFAIISGTCDYYETKGFPIRDVVLGAGSWGTGLDISFFNFKFPFLYIDKETYVLNIHAPRFIGLIHHTGSIIFVRGIAWGNIEWS